MADSRDNLRIRESGDGSVYVEDLSEHVVRNPRDVYRLLQHGKTQRATNSTKFNKASSRSHAVFTLTIEHSHSDGISENPDVTVGKLHLVDLAGSERYEATEVEKHQKETQNINLSLTAFGKVVLALTSRSHVSHVPYRESKLTRILQDSLGGNCRTAMITTISPAVFSCLETVASLKFANRAKSVKNKAVVNKDTNGESALLSAYQAEIIKLREMLKKQQQQQQQQQVAGPLSGRPHLTLELQAAHQKADEENSAIVSELRQRQLEVKEANEEKAYYVERIGDLERKLISGGTRVEDTTEFKMALTRERERLREEQQEREVQIEAERKRLEHEKAAFETERKKFALRTAVLSSSAAARAKHLSPIAASTPPISTLGRPLESPQRMAAVSSRSLPSAVRHNSFLATGNEASSVRAGSSDSDSDEFEMMPARLAAGCARPTSVASSSPRTDPAIPPSYGSDADPWAPVRRAASRPQTASAPKPAADLEAEALMEYSRALQDPRTGIPLSTKRVRLTTYRQCFTGAEAAGWFMANMEGIVSTEAARSVGQQLLDLGVIFHVKGQTVYLVSDQHLYQFRGSKMAASHDRGVNAPRPSGPRASRPKSSSSLASRGSLTMSRGSSASLASFSTAMSGESPEDGSDDFMEDVDGLTANPLHLAAAAGDLATVRALVATHGPDCLDALNRTPLMYAVIGNKGKVCRALIKSHANVNARDDNGNTPLLWAACRGCRDACGVLLREGSDVEAVDLAGRSALHWSTKLKRTDILELLLRKSFRHLTNRKDDEGLTALHWAIMCAHLPHVELLLAKLADPAVGDNEGRTPLHYAVSRNTLPGLQCLIERCPAVINVADNQGRTALHMACGEGNVEIVTLLLAAVGTDPNPIDHRLTTPLHWAVVCNRPDICRILLQAGGKVSRVPKFSDMFV